ncbi:hypothetical protein O1611_g1898 [Lasiodiplodia mahajangana]|uniref:Uncharacterized protein n=1 Tax=Lasiodiplodia mahajangana TaxID=1108764 RepID=A0ACC2JWE7_9PEZI|nr:hypothetical protein O1611_g1898 [Lasiodiplodia mahajangana]
MQPGRYARILPAPSQAQPEQPSTSGNSSGEPTRRSSSSQSRPGACIDCRTRKTKCDGARPACGNCRKRGRASCVYPERLINGHNAIEFVDLLKSLPEDRSSALLGRLREKGDLAAVMAEYKGGAMDSQPIPKLDPWESRQQRQSLEAELLANNPKAFPALPPIDHAALARSHLLRPGSSPSLAHPGLRETDGPPASSSDVFEPQVQPVEYCDERLQYLRIGFWTDVDISSDFAARIISLYVQMYSALDESAAKYASGFRQNAEALWRLEGDSYLSMAGAVLLSISLLGQGRDHAVLSYATDAIKMGTRLGLFGDIREQPNLYHPKVETVDQDLSAQCHAAWGAFNWNVMVSMFYRQPGSETPASAPNVPIPGETYSESQDGRIDGVEVDGAEESGDGGGGGGGEGEDEDEERGEAENPPEEIVLRRTFSVLCNFWRLVHNARWIYYAIQESPPVYLRNTLVEYIYRELIAWAESLPSFLLRRDQGPHYVVVFHIWLHTAILDIWQPFINKKDEEVPQLRTFTARDRTPDAAYTASVNQLKHLIVEYRSKYSASTYSILWHNGLIYLVNAMLRCTDPQWRLYLLLCIYGYERLNRAYRISEVITQGLLTMTMRDTNMSGAEAYKLMEELKRRGLVHVEEGLEEEIRATFMVDLSLALTDPEAANAENMAHDFADLATFQDLIDLDPMEIER